MKPLSYPSQFICDNKGQSTTISRRKLQLLLSRTVWPDGKTFASRAKSQQFESNFNLTRVDFLFVFPTVHGLSFLEDN